MAAALRAGVAARLTASRKTLYGAGTWGTGWKKRPLIQQPALQSLMGPALTAASKKTHGAPPWWEILKALPPPMRVHSTPPLPSSLLPGVSQVCGGRVARWPQWFGMQTAILAGLVSRPWKPPRLRPQTPCPWSRFCM